MRVVFLVMTIFFACNGILRSQGLVSVSGIIVDSAKVEPVPFVNVYAKKTRNGTSASEKGFFSLVARQSDTIVFSAIGYRTKYLPISDTLGRSRWSVVVSLQQDTIMLDETTVYPWPSKAKFREAFLSMEIDQPTPMEEMGHFPSGALGPIDTSTVNSPSPVYNPASFLYEKIILKAIDRLPKRKRAKELPTFE